MELATHKALEFYKVDDSSSQKKLRLAFVPCVRSCPGHPPHFQGQDGTVAERPCLEVLPSSEFPTSSFLWERISEMKIENHIGTSLSCLRGWRSRQCSQYDAHSVMDKHWVWVLLLSLQRRLKIPPS